MSQRGKFPRTAETRARMSEAAKGNRHWLGKKHKAESKAKIAAANRRRTSSNGYWAVHKWMRENHPKTGICEGCGVHAAGKLSHDFASIGHTYTRNRADWMELCRRCHYKLDAGIKEVGGP